MHTLYFSNLHNVLLPAPIFKEIEIQASVVTTISYNILFDRESIDNNFKQYINMILGEYMENWLNHKNGLWKETIEITKRSGLTLKIEELKAR
ncbi:hypothetical protein [Bacillus sp. AFS023182]|uniref:hypothetical protein n=1 Tax=Bacillus sp. AFS023182 TaxID=2033492 RepID=UPI001596E2DD|nr:hypothetical protein [Bacillus sp. AFS023182]